MKTIKIIITTLVVMLNVVLPVSAQTPPTIEINQVTVTDPASIAQVTDGSTMLLFQDSDYTIAYMKQFNHEFLITITGPSFDETRIKAENHLLKLLNVSKSDACWLYIITTTTNQQDSAHWLKNFEPSFCTLHESRRIRDKLTDLNLDGTTNVIDYVLVLNKYGQKDVDIPEDINGDKVIDPLDLSLILNDLGNASNIQL